MRKISDHTSAKIDHLFIYCEQHVSGLYLNHFVVYEVKHMSDILLRLFMDVLNQQSLKEALFLIISLKNKHPNALLNIFCAAIK